MIAPTVQLAFLAPRHRPRCRRCGGWIYYEHWRYGSFACCLSCGAETFTPRRSRHHARRWVFGEQLGLPTLGERARIKTTARVKAAAR